LQKGFGKDQGGVWGVETGKRQLEILSCDFDVRNKKRNGNVGPQRKVRGHEGLLDRLTIKLWREGNQPKRAKPAWAQNVLRRVPKIVLYTDNFRE